MKRQTQCPLQRSIVVIAAINGTPIFLGWFIHLHAELAVTDPLLYVPGHSAPVIKLRYGAQTSAHTEVSSFVMVILKHLDDLLSVPENFSAFGAMAIVQDPILK